MWTRNILVSAFVILLRYANDLKRVNCWVFAFEFQLWNAHVNGNVINMLYQQYLKCVVTCFVDKHWNDFSFYLEPQPDSVQALCSLNWTFSILHPSIAQPRKSTSYNPTGFCNNRGRRIHAGTYRSCVGDFQGANVRGIEEANDQISLIFASLWTGALCNGRREVVPMSCYVYIRTGHSALECRCGNSRWVELPGKFLDRRRDQTCPEHSRC